MSEQRQQGQTIFELFFLLLPFVFSFVFARIFFKYIRWWGFLPGVILGFGSVALLNYTLTRFSRKDHPRDSDSPTP